MEKRHLCLAWKVLVGHTNGFLEWGDKSVCVMALVAVSAGGNRYTFGAGTKLSVKSCEYCQRCFLALQGNAGMSKAIEIGLHRDGVCVCVHTYVCEIQQPEARWTF